METKSGESCLSFIDEGENPTLKRTAFTICSRMEDGSSLLVENAIGINVQQIVHKQLKSGHYSKNKEPQNSLAPLLVRLSVFGSLVRIKKGF